MILIASERGGAMKLAAHLLKPENEHIEIHEVRGFVAEDIKGAMKEAQAVAQGTRCQKFLFSVSLNPPESETVGIGAFESAIDRIEERTGLVDHPRIVVFHEKEGRRHCHAVWSRIDPETMTAKSMYRFKNKVQDIAKELYLEHGWQMPRGFMDSHARNPHNFSLAEWQQAKRMGRDPKVLKATIQECWTTSDSAPAFAKALEERGLYLARGDRRAHVAVTYEGEVLSIARMVGKKSKDVSAKLGDSETLNNVAETRGHIGKVIAPKLKGLIREADLARAQALQPLSIKRLAMKEQHKLERQRLDEGQRARSALEARKRGSRLRTGIAGIWDRLIGTYARIRRQNEAEDFESFRRDRAQRNELVADQLKERRGLQLNIRSIRHRHAAAVLELHRDLSRQRDGNERTHERLSPAFEKVSLRRTDRPREAARARGPEPSR